MAGKPVLVVVEKYPVINVVLVKRVHEVAVAVGAIRISTGKDVDIRGRPSVVVGKLESPIATVRQ